VATDRRRRIAGGGVSAPRYLLLVACGLALIACLPPVRGGGHRPAPPPPAAPRTVVLDGVAVLAIRNRLRSGDPPLTAALARLSAYADQQLTTGPYSVMDKLQAPPSGDRHDYSSQSIYAWLAAQAVAAGRAHVASQVRPDGSQPLELARATSWAYSVYNALALSRLAAIGRSAGADLWTYTAPDGASLRGAVDYLVPAATGERPWTAGRQVTALDPGIALPVLHAAADAGDATARAAIPRLPAAGGAEDPWLLSPAP
jgi:hypothetical protein